MLADMALCVSKDCPLRDRCLRARTKSTEQNQSYAEFKPYHVMQVPLLNTFPEEESIPKSIRGHDVTCEGFIEMVPYERSVTAP